MTPRLLIFSRLRVLSIAAVLALMPVSGMAASPDVATQVSQQLQAQGYEQIKVHRTLLGKVVVTARGHGHLREIVIDPRNGALLRDLVRNEGGEQGGVSIAKVGDRDGDDQDRDDADDDRNDDDDSSGSGSGSGSDDDDDNDDNSGSGGGGDDADDDSSGGDDDSGSDDSGSDDSGSDDDD